MSRREFFRRIKLRYLLVRKEREIAALLEKMKTPLLRIPVWKK